MECSLKATIMDNTHPRLGYIGAFAVGREAPASNKALIGALAQIIDELVPNGARCAGISVIASVA